MAARKAYKYKKSYCKKLLQHMEDGYSFESFGGVIKIAPSTLYKWVDDHPDFSEAKEIGFATRAITVEKEAMDLASGVTHGSPQMQIFRMKNLCKWVDKQEVDSNVKQTTTIQMSYEEVPTPSETK